MKPFTQLLGKHIEASGMKQTRIASTAGISYNYLQRLLSGDRNPSDQVVYKLAQALHLSIEQTSELLAAAGFAPPAALLQISADQNQGNLPQPVLTSETNHTTRLIQQFYRLAQEIPGELQTRFLEEMKHLLGYARYKYVLSKGADLLDLSATSTIPSLHSDGVASPEQSYLDLIAQLVGELHREPEENTTLTSEGASQPPQAVEDMLSAIDRLTGNILTGDISVGGYQPQVIMQTLEILREGAPWEIRRRIAEALPGLCKLDISGTEHLMEALRSDFDEVRGADIRRRVIEALATLFETSPQSLPAILRLLRPRSGDDTYVTLAIIEACEDIQAKIKQLLNGKSTIIISTEFSEDGEALTPLLHENQAEIARIQRMLLLSCNEGERESLQFSIALHNLLCAPDTLLISIQEGLQSPDKFVRYVAVRYLERLLPSRPIEVLTIYKVLLQTATKRNIRRTVAKALPSLLRCLKEESLSTRAFARDVISGLASDPDIYIRRAVADHAMQIFYIDREFLLILLRQMHKDTDLAIRHRLQPVALRLAQVWLTWYAETAGLVDTKRGRNHTLPPFGE